MVTKQEEAAIAEAYRAVADGYRNALVTADLPRVEVESLRRCLRAALEISEQPLLGLAAS